MEQESETPLLYGTVKRVGYSMRLAIHLLFIAIAFVGTIVLLATLVVNSF